MGLGGYGKYGVYFKLGYDVCKLILLDFDEIPKIPSVYVGSALSVPENVFDVH